MPRDIPCDRCRKAGRLCLPRRKGGQALTACAVCYGIKMSCKTSVGVTAGEKEVEEGVDFEEVEPEATMPDQEGKTGGTENMPGRSQRPQRTAVVWAWAQLEK